MVYILILLTAVSFALSIITMTRTVKLKRLLGEYRETTSKHELRIKKLENRYFKPVSHRNSDNVYINQDGIPVVKKEKDSFFNPVPHFPFY